MKTLHDQITEVIQDEPVAVFMKGTPQQIMCGNSLRALQALHAAGAPITAVDILPDPRIREELSAIQRRPVATALAPASCISASSASSRPSRARVAAARG